MMKRAGKILQWILISVLSLLMILIVLSAVLEKEISRIFLNELNKRLLIPANAREINFSLIRKFPRASIELREVLVKSPEEYDLEPFNPLHRDTLLYADEITVALKVTDLIRKKYLIEKADISDARFALLTGAGDKRKLSLFRTATKNDSAKLSVDLSNISIRNSRFILYNHQGGLIIDALFSSSSNRVRIEDNLTSIRSDSELHLVSLKNSKNLDISDLNMKLNTNLFVNTDSVSIGESEILVGELPLSVEGVIDLLQRDINLDILAPDSDIDNLLPLLPADLNDKLAQYDPGGKLDLNLHISGSLKKKNPLLLNSKTVISSGQLSFSDRDISLSNITGNFKVSGNLRDIRRTVSIYSPLVLASLNDNAIKTNISLVNLEKPVLDISLSGSFSLKELISLAKLEEINSKKGDIRLNIRLSGTLDKINKLSINDILKLDRSLNLGLSSLSLEYPRYNLALESVNGNIMVSDKAWFDDLNLVFGDQNIILNGMVSNIGPWLLKESNRLNITSGIWADRFDVGLLRDLIPEKDSLKKNKATRLSLNTSLSCDSIIMGKFRAAIFKAELGISPDFINVSSFSFNSLGGEISGNASLISLPAVGYAGRAWLDMNNINIRESFRVSNNFGQEHLTWKNIEGNMNGSFSVASTLDTAFKPLMKDLILNGSYEITDGRLIDFEPVYKLSKFIEIEELENISFSRLRNDLIIKDNTITIPNMQIESSAFDISVKGKHSFSGAYSYHVKVLLSDLISRRERTENKKITEFGIIEDDGLGRTSLFLKVDGTKSGTRVSHDMDALKVNIRQDMEAEKQNLKTILNEEYGWYEQDSLPEVTHEETRKFRIIWEEADSIAIPQKESDQKKLPLLKLFRKKKDKRSKIGSNWNN